MKKLLQWCSCFYLALWIGITQLGLMANGKLHASGKWYSNNKKFPYVSVLVDQSGHGNFSTVQSAIDSVPSNNKNWICIYIKAGIYREKVKIPYDRPYIILKGEAKRRTQIIWDDHDSTAQSPTFMSLADNIIVKSIRFVNSYNFLNSNNPRVPAVAAMIAGDKSAFYRCGFAGVQDTLWDDQGRHYFKKCTIQGAVDFIFGSGQSIYEGCAIQVIGDGFITAQGRTNPSDANGFVFKRCNVFGRGSAYLGRPWRGYSRVLFYQSNFTNVIHPEGWNAWDFVHHENQITFAEYGNFGPGADTKNRVSWAKKLSHQTLCKLVSMSFIDTENWIQDQPL
ncbi:Pectinesterase U1 precursor, putative [Ricinus communis]|uniref:Pectinesterase n=2 Tax=Ricinus communis TaxID=3988 RepID=B9RWI7_RICCO|nr:Pectinesterase U1 precursor, putative [Ricinus communis]|eukprot:XP_002518106.3 probable pectinesterase 29 [Ricinus communis]